MKNPGQEGRIWQSYYEQNMLFYEKLSEDIRPALLKRMQGDLQNAIYRKEFSRDHFDVTVRDEMELLLESTAEFDRLQRNKEQERRRERRKDVSGKDWMAVMSEKKEDELERLSRESAAYAEEMRRKNRLNRQWLTEEMGRDLAPLRMLLGLSADEMGTLLGISEGAYKSLESGKKEVSWDQYMALLFLFHYNERTTSVVDSLGLYPEPLKIRLREGLLYGFG